MDTIKTMFYQRCLKENRIICQINMFNYIVMTTTLQATNSLLHLLNMFILRTLIHFKQNEKYMFTN